MTFKPLWQRAHEAGFQPNLTALLRCIDEKGEVATQERYGWDYETLQNYERRIIARLKLIDQALAIEAETLLAPRSCVFCDQSPAPHGVTTFTSDQKAANKAWSESFKDGFHTGHCPHLELPAYACQACFDARPESHLTKKDICGTCKHWCWGGHHGHPSTCEHPKGIGDGGTICCTPDYNEPACHRYEKDSS